MKKLLIGLLALGLVFSFSVPVMATDFSVSGAYRIRGWLDSNSPLYKDDAASDAYFDQRFRVQPKFTVVEGLSATIRFDCLEGVWGDDLRSVVPEVGYGGSGFEVSNNTDANIQFDKAYVTFMTAYGQVEAGFKSTNVWGTDFGNTEDFVGEIDFMTKLSENLALLFRIEKDVEQDAFYNNRIQDEDKDAYIAAAVYNMEGIEAGLLYKGVRDYTRSYVNTMVHVISPYAKANLADGIYVEGQIYWATGSSEVDDGYSYLTAGSGEDLDWSDLLLYLMAKADVGPAYVGAVFAYAEGDDDPTDKDIKGALLSGSDWNPCLILFNDTQPTSVGTYGTTGTALNNAYLWQAFAGMSPMENLSVKATLSYAYADEKLDFKDDNYGTEFDIEAHYKIYDNLDYMVGFGYLFAGDYYKGDSSDNEIDDTYLLMNKLQVDF
jgi:hypothetical protein